METAELIVVFLLAMVFLGILAQRLAVPYPVLFVLGGLALGFLPGLPPLVLAPELIFLVFLPPLLMAGGWFTSRRDLRANARPIIWLAVGLVLVNTGVVAVVSHAALGLGWAVAFVLGAIVSPTDDVAVIALAQTLRIPPRVMTIVSAEGLFNDVTSLVAYGVAVTAVTTGAFSVGDAVLSLVVVAVGGAAIGLAAGLLIDWTVQRIDDVSLAITFTLLTPYAVYLAATALGVSAVLAVVVTGVVSGSHEARTFRAITRRPALAVWQALTFLLNAFLFILVGLDFPAVLRDLVGPSLKANVGYAALISLTVIVFRLLWVFVMGYAPWLAGLPRQRRSRPPNWRNAVLMGWAGTRGAISLAAALALPLAFPGRSLIIFVTFGVIFSTLVLQGVSLPSLLRWLRIADDGKIDREESVARAASAEAALRVLADPEVTGAYPAALVDDLRTHYTHDLRRASRETDAAREPDVPRSADSLSPSKRLRLGLIAAEREAIIGLRDQGEIGDQVLRRVEEDLDLEELRLS